jgi:hypothetical protein
MRFSRCDLGASYLATHNHSAIPEVTLCRTVDAKNPDWSGKSEGMTLQHSPVVASSEAPPTSGLGVVLYQVK